MVEFGASNSVRASVTTVLVVVLTTFGVAAAPLKVSLTEAGLTAVAWWLMTTSTGASGATFSAFGAGDWVPIAAMVGSTILVRLTPSRPEV